MTVMWILALILAGVVLAGMTAGFFYNRNIRKKIEKGELKEAPEVRTVDGECCGQHAVCEKESLLAAVSRQIEYYDDEELDRFKGRPSDAYTEEERHHVHHERRGSGRMVPEPPAPGSGIPRRTERRALPDCRRTTVPVITRQSNESPKSHTQQYAVVVHRCSLGTKKFKNLHSAKNKTPRRFKKTLRRFGRNAEAFHPKRQDIFPAHPESHGMTTPFYTSCVIKYPHAARLHPATISGNSPIRMTGRQKAAVSFYTADIPSDYTTIVEGIGGEGQPFSRKTAIKFSEKQVR